MPSVLFVCLGNICRSPLAEAALREEARRRGLDLTIDSAGTGNWHVGHPPDPRAIAAAARAGVDIRAQRARQVTRADFTRFDHIVALDRQNLRDLQDLAPAAEIGPDDTSSSGLRFQPTPKAATARLHLLLDHVPGRQGQGVADPYTGVDEDFDTTWAEVTLAARALIDWLEA